MDNKNLYIINSLIYDDALDCAKGASAYFEVISSKMDELFKKMNFNLVFKDCEKKEDILNILEAIRVIKSSCDGDRTIEPSDILHLPYDLELFKIAIENPELMLETTVFQYSDYAGKLGDWPKKSGLNDMIAVTYAEMLTNALGAVVTPYDVHDLLCSYEEAYYRNCTPESMLARITKDLGLTLDSESFDSLGNNNAKSKLLIDETLAAGGVFLIEMAQTKGTAGGYYLVTNTKIEGGRKFYLISDPNNAEGTRWKEEAELSYMLSADNTKGCSVTKPKKDDSSNNPAYWLDERLVSGKNSKEELDAIKKGNCTKLSGDAAEAIYDEHKELIRTNLDNYDIDTPGYTITDALGESIDQNRRKKCAMLDVLKGELKADTPDTAEMLDVIPPDTTTAPDEKEPVWVSPRDRWIEQRAIKIQNEGNGDSNRFLSGYVTKGAAMEQAAEEYDKGYYKPEYKGDEIEIGSHKFEWNGNTYVSTGLLTEQAFNDNPEMVKQYGNYKNYESGIVTKETFNSDKSTTGGGGTFMGGTTAADIHDIVETSTPVASAEPAEIEAPFVVPSVTPTTAPDEKEPVWVSPRDRWIEQRAIKIQNEGNGDSNRFLSGYVTKGAAMEQAAEEYDKGYYKPEYKGDEIEIGSHKFEWNGNTYVSTGLLTEQAFNDNPEMVKQYGNYKNYESDIVTKETFNSDPGLSYRYRNYRDYKNDNPITEEITVNGEMLTAERGLDGKLHLEADSTIYSLTDNGDVKITPREQMVSDYDNGDTITRYNGSTLEEYRWDPAKWNEEKQEYGDYRPTGKLPSRKTPITTIKVSGASAVLVPDTEGKGPAGNGGNPPTGNGLNVPSGKTPTAINAEDKRIIAENEKAAGKGPADDPPTGKGYDYGYTPPKKTTSSYTLTIKYVYSHNPSYTVYTETKTLKSGEAYNFTPRSAMYYNATPSIITGVMPGSNFEVLVTYMPINDINGNGKADEEENLTKPRSVVEPVETPSISKPITDTVITDYGNNNTNNNSSNYTATSLSSKIDTTKSVADLVDEIIPEEISEIVAEPEVILPNTHAHASANLSVNEPKKNNIWPAIGIAAGVATSAVGVKAIVDDDEDKKEE